MPAAVESEIKLRVGRPEDARAALAGLGAERVRARHFEDNVLFDDAASSLASGGRVLRLRRTEAGGVLTHKAPRSDRDGVKVRTELETAVGDPDALQAIVHALGFRPVFRYQKYREVYRWKDVEIVVDETPIGAFLEIEGPVSAIHEAAAALGYAPADYMRDSYVSLFFAAGGQGDMTFE
ncbi:MAG TPA: class IV adenylate cyclase [Vicinamibacteria bacterium]|nr:class IV adenylate cyclase [Vicinamibacteria bacterium]